ncbi:MAG: RsmB/NOP family class I SAM-dependent RNA methyltransferase [Sphingomonas sp.]
MTPGARSQAAIELLDAIVAAARDQGPAADTLIARYFAERRYAGSKDRRAVRELVYAAIRRAGDRPASGRAALLGLAIDEPTIADTFDGGPHAPAPIAADEPVAAGGAAPEWLVERLSSSGLDDAEMLALIGRAPLDVRANTLNASRDDVAAAIPDAEPLPRTRAGLRLPAGTNVEALAVYRDGQVEVQDEGSQIVSDAAAARSGMGVIDLCAGAGGKSLALAAAMGNRGTILACDVDRGRLGRLSPRATRAGATVITTRLLDPGREADALADWHDRADVVLVDAPCSGTGTWRRNPEARWRLTPDRLDRLAATQQHLLDVAARCVKPGGAITYIVCSLLDAEGADQAQAFLARRPEWRAEPLSLPAGRPRGQGVRLTPAHDGTDGFFVARLVRPC